MKKNKTLTSEDRRFFTLVAQAVFTNPFSEKRKEVDALIAGKKTDPGPYDSLKFIPFMPRLARRLERLQEEGMGRIDPLEGEDRKVMKYTWLFYIYHRYLERLDELIQSQVQEGETPTQVPFARELLGELVSKGLKREEALRFFALFYQLRRAFYFIVKGLVGSSPPMKRIRFSLWNNIFTHDISLYDLHLWNRREDFSTLLLGETGTGKGTAAAAIGRSGCIPFNERRNCFEESFTKTFLAINLSQYPETLIESELFGHRKGAFTGAVEHHEGIFSRGSPFGALFLDEIGEVSIPVQIKLLQVIQERTFSPVGSHVTKRFEGRVIAATNKPLSKLRREGCFRDDFFYRLSSDVIVVPPLRQRIAEDPKELDELISLVVNRTLGEEEAEVARMVKVALKRDLPPQYGWPGNVRELEQAVRRILLTGSYLGEESVGYPDILSGLLAGIEKGTLDAKELMGSYCALLYERHHSYEEVARRTNLDRRTAKKYIESRMDKG
jgi:DNA-binding NtrC family response regulator